MALVDGSTGQGTAASVGVDKDLAHSLGGLPGVKDHQTDQVAHQRDVGRELVGSCSHQSDHVVVGYC